MVINLLQRHHLALFVLLSGLCGLALGHLCASAIGLATGPAPLPEISRKATTGSTRSNLPLSSFQEILDRNIFNAATQSPKLQVREEPQPEQRTAARTKSQWKLIGTISGGHTPLATLSEGREVSIFRLNETLPDGAELALIDRNRVELRYPDGNTQVLETESDSPLDVRHPEPTVQSGAPSSSLEIEEVGENQWRIPADLAEDARSNIGNLLKQAQAVPYLENGATTGFQIRMIQPNSLFAQIGLQKGDILREINGIPLNSPEKALQIFGQLRLAKQISIGLERRGKAMTFAYEIR